VASQERDRPEELLSNEFRHAPRHRLAGVLLLRHDGLGAAAGGTAAIVARGTAAGARFVGSTEIERAFTSRNQAGVLNQLATAADAGHWQPPVCGEMLGKFLKARRDAARCDAWKITAGRDLVKRPLAKLRRVLGLDGPGQRARVNKETLIYRASVSAERWPRAARPSLWRPLDW